MILYYGILFFLCALNRFSFSEPLVASSLPNVTDSNTEPDESPHLGQIKVGLAAAFFFSVLIACGLPIVLIDYLRKREPKEISRANDILASHDVEPFDSGRAAGCSKSDEDEESPPNGSWNHQPSSHGVIRQLSIDEEYVQSPPPGNLENTDLLTGHPVGTTTTAGWSRRFQGRISPRLTVNSNEPRRRSPVGRRGCFSRSRAEYKLLLRVWFSRCNCFAAGIFLSSGFMELYIDVEESIEEAKAQLNIVSDFPFGPFLTLIGFFMVLSIEQIVLTVRSAKHHPDAHALRKQSSGSDCSPLQTPLSPQYSADPVQTSVKFLFNGNATHITRAASSPNPLVRNSTSSPRYYGPTIQRTKAHSHHSHLPDPQSLDSFSAILRVILLLCAMSVHSLFEGLAVGLQSTVQHTVALFSAILLHKLIIAAGIGVNLATAVNNGSSVDGQCDTNSSSTNNGISRRTFCYQTIATLIFSSSSPLGVLIGLGLMQQQQSGALLMTTAALQGLACGTFFFVVFCELLPQEFRDGVGDRLGKLLFLILGFALVALYSYVMPH